MGFLLLRNLLTYEENKEEFCLENPDYNPHIVSRFEYIYVLLQQLIQDRIYVLVYHDRLIFYLGCSERLSLIYRSIKG